MKVCLHYLAELDSLDICSKKCMYIYIYRNQFATHFLSLLLWDVIAVLCLDGFMRHEVSI